MQRGVGGMPTAFVASFGSGKPVIAIIGEYDALPGTVAGGGARAESSHTPAAPGHGCGHNLFGTASMAAAIAVKDWLATTGRAGTIRFYGTPAEEGGEGKVYMLRAGLFADVDVAIAWHPGGRNDVSAEEQLAQYQRQIPLHGRGARMPRRPPTEGDRRSTRSRRWTAMVNLMREHVPQETRIHYVITDGGEAPNVVPDFAEVYYYARHADMRVLDGIWERIGNAAKGAALGHRHDHGARAGRRRCTTCCPTRTCPVWPGRTCRKSAG